MARPSWQPSDDELARRLADVGERLAYPPAADVAASVRARLESARPLADNISVSARGRAEAAGRRPRAPLLTALPRRVALSIAALALLLGGALAVSPATRRAVAQWLGLRGVVILPLPRPAPAPTGAGLRLGQRVTLAEARARLHFRVLIPARLGAPDEVYLRSVASGAGPRDAVVSLVYRAGPGLPRAKNTGVGLLLTETRGATLVGKFVDPGTRLEFVTVGGESRVLAGYWLTGQPHLVAYLDATGAFRMDTLRLAGNVLLWNRDGLVLRLEDALPKDAALRIAASMQ